MRGLRSLNYSGKIYPVNRDANRVFGRKSYKDLGEEEGPVDLAVLAIPEEFVRETIDACCQKRFITIIAAGFGETSERGRGKQ
jgi:acyl-CoA synthetase (NDP forming)